MTAPETIPGGGVRLEAVDRFAARAVAGAAPLRLELARTLWEREAVYRLRYRHVIEAGWAGVDELPDGMEHDSFDEWATHVVAWDGDAPVGTCRLVFPDGARPLPPEAAFDLVVEPRGRAPTVDRLLVATSRRGRGVTVAVLARAWIELRARGFELISGVATVHATRLFSRMGFDVAVIGGPRVYWGEQRYAILATPTAAPAAAE